MDRAWMYDLSRRNFDSGLEEFFESALEHQRRTGAPTIACPCRDCALVNNFKRVDDIRCHLITRGFMAMYERWTLHGESDNGIRNTIRTHCKRPRIETPVEVETIDIPEVDVMHGQYDVAADSGVNVDTSYDVGMEEMLNDVHEHLNEKPVVYQTILEASEKALCPGSSYSKLSAVLSLFNVKARFGAQDKLFDALFELIQDFLPKDNQMPSSLYEAKKLLSPMGIGYEKIDACPNHCILYRGKYANLDKCPHCPLSRYKQNVGVPQVSGKKGISAKVLWYFPIIPRFKRLFANERDARYLRWHAEGRKNDGKLRHPADSPQWRNINRVYKHEFGDEVRNLRLGLSTDGMNPFSNMSTQHSTWPVCLSIYNLPPWLCMKRKYLMLSLLIAGPKQPGHSIDVYLAPLIDDLKILWHEGTKVYDAYKKESFTLKAMLFCTINDFPAYGNLSGYTVKGNFACPICEDDTCTIRLKFCGKNVYMDYRRFLSIDHPFRKRRKIFGGKSEKRVARTPLTGREVFDRVKEIVNVFGSTSKLPKNIWKKCCIFFELPYWSVLSVRHCLDAMHIIKNVGEAIIGTFLNVPGKTKDGLKVRKDMQAMNIRPELHPVENGKRTWLPPACYTLSRDEKTSLCKCLQSVKVPSGYSSNWKKLVSMKDLKLMGMKSHDYHVLLLHILPVALRGILPTHVRDIVTRLCSFLKAICAKVVDPNSLDALQDEIVEILCELEVIFPPSFFDIMVHLLAHLVHEIKCCGPVHLRYMYPFERYMGILKGRMKNRYRPEGSIAEGTINEEVTGYVTDYLNEARPVGNPISRQQENFEGKGVVGKKTIALPTSVLSSTHLYVLQHLEVVEPYFEKHMYHLKTQHPTRGEVWLTKEQNKSFLGWFRSYVMTLDSLTPGVITEEIRYLAFGPSDLVTSYEGYDINGYTYYTKRQDDKSINQNSGVKLEASRALYVGNNPSLPVSTSSCYYGVIQDMWELNFHFDKFLVFHCKWVDNQKGLDVDGIFTRVDLTQWGEKDEPFTFASYCEQVWYLGDPKDRKFSVVMGGRKTFNVADDEAMAGLEDVFDETPSILNVHHRSNLNSQDDPEYEKTTHQEGSWVNTLK